MLDTVDKEELSVQVGELVESDVENAIALHLATWSQTELSAQLGAKFLRLFFLSLVSSPYGKCFVVKGQSGLLGYICAFANFSEFNSSLRVQNKLQMVFITLKALVLGRLSIKNLLVNLKKDPKLLHVKEPAIHLGACSIKASKASSESPQLVAELLVPAALHYLRDRGGTTAWASCDLRNRPAHFLMNRFGFRSICTIPYGNRELVIFECDLLK